MIYLGVDRISLLTVPFASSKCYLSLGLMLHVGWDMHLGERRG